MGAERRSGPRVKPKETLFVDYPAYRASVRDINLSGAFIEDPRPIPPGHVIRLRIQLSESESITANVMVRRVEQGRGMGVEFLAMNVADRDRLRKIVGGKTVFEV